MSSQERQFIMKTFQVTITNEWFNASEKLIAVVQQLYDLRTALLKTKSLEGYKAYCNCYAKMNALLRKITKTETANVMLCKVERGICWILELDYLEDGDSPIEIYGWPSIEELNEEGLDTLKGENITVVRLDEELEDNDEEGFIEELVDEFE